MNFLATETSTVANRAMHPLSREDRGRGLGNDPITLPSVAWNARTSDPLHVVC